jgi:putative ABC transport system permease protein
VDLGFEKDNIVLINSSNLPPATRKELVDLFRANPAIAGAAISSAVPLTSNHTIIDVRLTGSAITNRFHPIEITPDYMQVYGIRLLAGRLFSEQHSEDASTPEQLAAQKGVPPANMLVNAAGARRLGLSPQQAIGKLVFVHDIPATIVGVVSDAKLEGPKYPVDDTIFYYPKDLPSNWLSVGIHGGQTQEALSAIDRTWHALAPSVAIQRHFLDDDYNRQFFTDEQQGTIFTLFVAIAVFIASLGQFGLAAFSTERRTKEIGLRKTFGARTRDIILLLLWQFSIPVLIANLIAWPVAYYYLHNWLEGYAYRIDLNPLYFMGVGAAALVVAWSTVIVHAMRAARANPIHALRYE